eukprot:CAMPEP_0197485938 /NCGR_PEP_ID=MMETSP1311-20131121/848_1 /TAXON_ID=464262 /ORGANISM="Genus nov. species nov., Strain RCC856" /LENGTH=65 /DNA_ID=CAMNT_0043028757 /DNA_START=266 /DNA_END=460 /DNA_ORIENTATION=+
MVVHRAHHVCKGPIPSEDSWNPILNTLVSFRRPGEEGEMRRGRQEGGKRGLTIRSKDRRFAVGYG